MAADSYLVSARHVWDGVELLRDVDIQIDDGRVTRVTTGGSTTAGRRPVDRRVYSEECLLTPGMVNAHQHGRAAQVSALGVRDAALEEWLLAQAGLAPSSVYRETVAVARRLLAGGVTATLHVHGGAARLGSELEAELREILRAYSEVGVRATVAVEVRDRGVPIYGLECLDPDSRASVPRHAEESESVPVTEVLNVVDNLRAHLSEGVYPGCRIGLAPPGQPWCSPDLMRQVADYSARTATPVHTHLSETRSEVRFGWIDDPSGPVGFLDSAGLLNDRLSVAHGVWLTAGERDALAAAGVAVVTNPSSNLRLASGIAQVGRMVDAQMAVAVGTDNLALSGMEDVLGELRLAAALSATHEHRRISAARLLTMATGDGARALGRDDVGRIREHAPADYVVLRVPHPVRFSSATLDAFVHNGAVVEVYLAGARVDCRTDVDDLTYSVDRAASERARDMAAWARRHYALFSDGGE